jgi:Secretion system C-terminal sorting domain
LKAGIELKITPMFKKLLSLLVLLTTLSNLHAQQAEIIGSLFYNNATNRITVRLAIHNKTGSAADMGYAGQRWGIQYNNSAVTFDGYFSYMYLGTNQSTGLNDASAFAWMGVDNGPNTLVPDDIVSPTFMRTASITGGGTKTLQMGYINRSSTQCANAIIVAAGETRILLDIYFTLNDPNLANFYNLNSPDYGFDSPDFIAQFFTKNSGGHTSPLLSPKTEIAITVIRQGNSGNPYQPFSIGSCVSGSVNVITVAGDDIFFLDPEEGVLSTKLRFSAIKENLGHAELKWGVENNHMVDHFEVERQEAGGSFKTIGLVMGDNVSGSKDYAFKDKLTGSESELKYRVKTYALDGAVNYSSIMKLNVKQVGETEIRITPNPVATTAQLNLPAINGNYLCRVYNMDGRMVYTAQLQGRSAALSVSQLSTGTYFMEAFHPQTGKRYYGKFTKQ